MMSILSNTLNFDSLVRTINNYSSSCELSKNLTCLNWTRFANQTEIVCGKISHTDSMQIQKQRDIESLLYLDEEFDSIIIEIYDDHNTSCSSVLDHAKLPIGTGRCFFGSLVWSRPSENSDFDTLYKGFQYRVDYKDLQFVCEKIKIDFESAIKAYIENNMDTTATICHFLV